MKVTQKEFGRIGSEIVYSYTMRNKNGIEVTCINYGGRITSIKTPDKHGNIEDIVLGYETLEEYISDTCYFGALCGRVAGRISNASFEIDGNIYELTKNEGNNHLHGGKHNFSYRIWRAEAFEREEEAGVVLSYFSKDGEEGYPGNVEINVTYLLNNDNEFTISYKGVPDKKTLINMTSHSYFNLSGETKRNVLGHILTIDSDRFIELSKQAIPTGRILDVEGTPFDLRKAELLSEQFSKEHPQLAFEGGYNHPFLLNSHFNKEIILQEETSGRELVVETDRPSVVVYSANFFNDEFLVRNASASKHLGICLETQGVPDAISYEHFPQVIVEKNQVYRAKTKYTFNTR